MGYLHEKSTDLMHRGPDQGAERLGYQWIIPIDAEKPKDVRIKSGKYIKTRSGREARGLGKDRIPEEEE